MIMIIIIHILEYDEKAIQSHLTLKGGMVKEHTSNRSTAVYYNGSWLDSKTISKWLKCYHHIDL